MDRWMDGRSFGWFWLVALPLCYYRFFCCCRCLPFRFRVLLSSLLKYKLRTANDTCAVCMVEIPENNTNNNSNSNRNDSSSSSGNSTNEKRKIFDLNRHFHFGARFRCLCTLSKSRYGYFVKETKYRNAFHWFGERDWVGALIKYQNHNENCLRIGAR